MNTHAVLQFLSGNGIAILQFFHQLILQGKTQDDLTRDYALDRAWVGSVMKLAKELFDPRPSPSREECISVAKELGLGIEVLKAINPALGRLNKKASVTKDDLRLRLYREARGMTPAEAKAHANTRVVALNDACGATPRKPAVRISKSTDAAGQRHIHASLDDATASAVAEKLHAGARWLTKKTPSLSYSQAMAEIFAIAILDSPALGGRKRREGLILLPADGYTHRGNGMLATTDGSLIPAHKLAEHLLEEYGYTMLYALNDEGVPEPVDLYRTKRYANDKQRLMITADQLTCSHPDCHRLANNSHIHHCTAWERGGETNVNNLVAACATHNRRNDDDPERHKNGYFRRMPHSGCAGFQPADPSLPPRRTRVPFAAYSARVWACDHFGVTV
ncbi:HNH endonuclease signature motif containing protein [Corynebacterium diphtheriae]